MDYSSYLNQGGGFDPSSCAMPGMSMHDGSGGGLQAACSLGAYGDLGRCGGGGQMPSSHQAVAAAAAYGAYNSMRSFNPHHVGGGVVVGGGGGGSMGSGVGGSCSMLPRSRDMHSQPPMFPTGVYSTIQ